MGAQRPPSAPHVQEAGGRWGASVTSNSTASGKTHSKSSEVFTVNAAHGASKPVLCSLIPSVPPSPALAPPGWESAGSMDHTEPRPEPRMPEENHPRK